MRKTLYAAFLLGTTALYPAPAHAMPPVVGFIGGIITALGAPAIGGAIAGAFGGFSAGAFAAGWAFAGSALGGLLLNAALSVGISALATLLRPRPDAPPNPGARMVNMRQPISFFEHAYGLVRKGGPVNFWQAKDGKRYYDVILAARQINGIRQWFADETEFTVDGNGLAQQARFQSDGRSRLRVAAFLGAAGQLAPALLADNFPQWTAAHDMAGLAHVVAVAETVKAEDFSKVYPGGREPVIAPAIEGYLCYDPRDQQTKWTTNAALIIADWITSKDGLDREVDWDQVAVEADVCDQVILDRDGNPVRCWQLSGVYSSADDRDTVRASMGVACDAFFYEDTNGIVGFNVGRFIQPDVEITDDDILSIQYTEGQAGTDIANAFSVEYTEPEIGYREAASAPYVLDVPDEPYEEDSLRVYWSPNHNQSVRVAKRLLLVSRARYKISATLKYHGIRRIGKRFFRLRHAEFGNLDQIFEVDKLKRNEDGITWSVEAHSVQAPDFGFNSATEEPQKPKRTSIETSSEVPAPTSVTAVSQPYAGSVAIRVEWAAPPRDSLLHQVRYRVASPPGEWTTLNAPVGQNHQNILGLLDNQTYHVQARAMTNSGKASEWRPEPPIAVTARVDPVPPGVVTGVNAVGGAGVVDIDWTAPNSPNYFATIIYRNTVNDLGSAALVVTEYGAPSAADSWQDSGLSAGTYYYWLVAANQSGVPASAVPTGSIIVT